ncbi:hypothetical protein J4424_06030 [Candidatus Woesearchaeota archaeon]|nr:hypothetical protein [Candidatus Woesearchaeota archaeon]
MMKRLLIALMFVLSLVAVPALADTSSNYVVNQVYVDGMILSSNTIYVERGENQELVVYLTGTGVTTDVNIRAWIGGYEYDNVQVASAMFDIEDGVSYQKKLTLEFPTDLEADQEYTLYVEVYDDVDSVTYSGTIMVSKVRHSLEIQDVLVDSNVDAGDYTTATVRLENLGDKKEEDIKVTVSIPELGVEESTFLDELTNNEIDNEDEESSGDVSLTFQIPADAESGDYEVQVSVSYNKGYDSLEEATSISVASANVAETDALRLGFGILAVLIVILALILIVRR